MKRFSVLIQYVAPQQALSRLAGWLSTRRWRWWKNWQINLLIRRYGAKLDEAVHSDLAAYSDFNSFFTRHLKPALRPIAPSANDLVSPVDGVISQLGNIDQDQVFQAKGVTYSLASLLGGASDCASQFHNGKFITLYLAPKDYHRVHLPYAGTLRETIYIPGKLFSVNRHTVNDVPQLFSRNERLVCIFTTDIGPMAVIFVGAMLVGNIVTTWQAAPRARQVTRTPAPALQSALQFAKGAEIGHFTMGSTVLVLLPHNTMEWAPHLRAETIVKMGQSIANISPP